MTITFYILEDVDTTRANLFLCDLIEKKYAPDKHIYIHTATEQEAKTLDELLWTHRVHSFIPHHISGDNSIRSSPIEIGFQAIPENLSKFNEIIEFVPSDSEKQAQARERYKYYRQKGFNITTHKLKTSDL